MSSTRVTCICGKEITKTNLSRHTKSIQHKEIMVNKKISQNPSPNTILVRENSDKHIDSIMNNIPNARINIVYEKLKEKGLAGSTVEKILRVGYMRKYAITLDRKELRHAEIFIRDLKDTIQMENDKKEIEMPILKDIIDNPKTPNEIRLYCMMPLRLESYTKLIISDKAEELEDQNHINLNDGKLYVYNTKMSDADIVILNKDTIDLAKTIKHNIQLYGSPSSLQRALARYVGYNSQTIRKAYAIQHSNRVYAARVLGHSNVTHRGYYEQ